MKIKSTFTGVVFLLAVNQSLLSQAIDRFLISSISSTGSIYDTAAYKQPMPPATAAVGAPACTGANQAPCQ